MIHGNEAWWKMLEFNLKLMYMVERGDHDPSLKGGGNSDRRACPSNKGSKSANLIVF
jgi:hypothetical protein